MIFWQLVFGIFLFHLTKQQRVAPGVPPQHYQQPQQPPPPQYQQPPPPQYQQQVPLQQQHVPIQQQQQFQQMPPSPQYKVPVDPQAPVPQQVPIQQHGDHGTHHFPGTPGQILNAANMEHEKEHLAEHLSVPIDTSKMTEQELQFHYFKMHDADNNNKLDGCELIKSLIHWHVEDNKNAESEVIVQSDVELELLVDPLLNDIDKDLDGFIDWAEYVQSYTGSNPRG